VTTKELASKYIQKTEKALGELRILQSPADLDSDSIIKVVEEAKRYLEDAKYYLDRKRFETSLASIAYSEGLLDALRMLRFVEFSWHARQKDENRKEDSFG